MSITPVADARASALSACLRAPCRFTPHPIALLIGVLLLSGCGGGGDAPPDTALPRTPDAAEPGPGPSLGGANPTTDGDPSAAPTVDTDRGGTGDETVGGGTGDGEPDRSGAAEVSLTALEIISTHPSLGLLARAIPGTDLVARLGADDATVTAFVPSDTAFAEVSALQRDALLNDPERLARLLRGGIVDGQVLRAGSAAAGIRASTIGGDRLSVWLADGAMRVASDHSDVESDVVASETTAKAAVHVIDDIHFFLGSSELLEPDPGSVAEALEAAPAYGDFLSMLRRDGTRRLYDAMGDVERHWTVLVPPTLTLGQLDAAPYRIADHVVESAGGAAGDAVALRPGELTAASGLTLVFAADGPGVSVNGVEITRAGARVVPGGAIHEIGYPVPELDEGGVPLGTESVVALLERLPVENHDGYVYSASGSAEGKPYRFFSALIDATGLESEYADPTARRTLLVPRLGYALEEIESRFGGAVQPWVGEYLRNTFDVYAGTTALGDAYVPPTDGWPSMYWRFERDGASVVPDLFPDVEAARAFLRAHTVETTLREATLLGNVGAELRTMGGQTVAIGARSDGVRSDAAPADVTAGITLGGERVTRAPELAFNGAVVEIERALAPTPDVFGIETLVEPEPDTAFGLLKASGEHTLFVEAVREAGFAQAFSDPLNDNFLIFAPIDSALGDGYTNAGQLLLDHVVIDIKGNMLGEEGNVVVDGVFRKANNQEVRLTRDRGGATYADGLRYRPLGRESGGAVFALEGVLE